MIDHFDMYFGLPDGLIELSCPSTLRITGKDYDVPKSMDELTNNICYGQRLFLTREEVNDIGTIFRMVDGYYYPIVERLKWDEDKVLPFGNKVLDCLVKEVYPVSIHLINLLKEMIEREEQLLSREYTKMEKAAGIEKLNLYAELNSLHFLRDTMKCSVPEVLLTPYNECLVHFMNAKAVADYQDRYVKLQREQTEIKPKYSK